MSTIAQPPTAGSRALRAAAVLAAAAAAALPGAAAQAGAPWDAALHLLPPSRVAEFSAACLDGSPPGYYYRPAPSGAKGKFKIHIQVRALSEG